MYSALKNTKREKKMPKVELMELPKELIQNRERLPHRAWLVYKKCQRRKLYEDLNRLRIEK